ncbi:transmembrane protein, putative (macronuclear) [Tetrahymena thermophila SB210]|uniref:Transmembrane protein, putative n=1 Tax=Tetrahymena thermophila (strain SB210) TaxID=312017 RepID=W7XAK0_TETTS|nr:transmembrane protein, putative [Tetrahymena thermophila SB210]EWS76410.1 transmembrane protein, putative [Tetrahymena thermophila SB210]|eukprot:XP_012651034.1 transmembrane protein, putative [Tetrahymena thermophila SB210]
MNPIRQNDQKKFKKSSIQLILEQILFIEINLCCQTFYDKILLLNLNSCQQKTITIIQILAVAFMVFIMLFQFYWKFVFFCIQIYQIIKPFQKQFQIQNYFQN